MGSRVLTFNSIPTFCTVMERDFPDECLFFQAEPDEAATVRGCHSPRLPQSKAFVENLMYWIIFFLIVLFL